MRKISDKTLVQAILFFGFLSFMLGTKALTTNGLAGADRRKAA
jgi:hypothetical protein